MEIKNNKFYTIKYQDKYVSNYAVKEPSNPNKWVLDDGASKDFAKRWFSWSGQDVKNIFLPSNVELEIEEIDL